MRVSSSLRTLIFVSIAFEGLSYLLIANRLEFMESYLSRGQVISKDYGSVLFVPGSGCNPGVGTQERLDLAASLYSIKARKVLVSEAICSPKEQKRFHEYMIDSLRIKASDIKWIAQGENSKENAMVCAEFCEENGIREFILCTSSFHQARMSLHLSRAVQAEFKIADMPEALKKYKKIEPYRSRYGKMMSREFLALLKAKWIK